MACSVFVQGNISTKGLFTRTVPVPVSIHPSSKFNIMPMVMYCLTDRLDSEPILPVSVNSMATVTETRTETVRVNRP